MTTAQQAFNVCPINCHPLPPTQTVRWLHAARYGIKPTDGSTKNVKVGGNGNMESAVYAPDSAVEINGGGSSGQFSGSVVGKTVFMNGVTTVHYDESLARSGLVTDYRIVSWVEDTR